MVKLIPVIGGVIAPLGKHPQVPRWVNPDAIAQIIRSQDGDGEFQHLHVSLTDGGGLDIADAGEAARFLEALGLDSGAIGTGAHKPA